MNRRRIRVSALVIALCYAALAFSLLRGAKAFGLALWATSPLVVPLIIALVARRKSTQWVAFALLFCFAGVGALLLPWGLVWNPGDYNHLVVLFLPLYEFSFLALALVALGIASIVYRHAR